MTLDIEESKEMCDWLLRRQLSLEEAALFLCYMGAGDPFSVALLNVFKHRQIKLEKINDKKTIPDWGNPITP